MTSLIKRALKNILSKFQSKLGWGDFGSFTIIKPPYKVWNRNKIEIGHNTYIAENAFFAITLTNSYKNPKVIIGSNCTIGSNFFCAAIHSITIKDNVLISNNVFISDHIHGYSDIDKPIISQNLIYRGSVCINNGCFIGINVVIKPGVNIGKNSIIDANSVVASNVPDYTIVSGNPAKVIKRFTNGKWMKINEN